MLARADIPDQTIWHSEKDNEFVQMPLGIIIYAGGVDVIGTANINVPNTCIEDVFVRYNITFTLCMGDWFRMELLMSEDTWELNF